MTLQQHHLESTVLTGTPGGLEHAVQIWEELNSEQAAEDLAATVFGFSAWARHAAPPGSIPLLALWKNGEPRALLPVQAVEKRAVLRFRALSTPTWDHWKLSYPVTGVDADGAIGGLLKSLLQRRNWDVMELGPMLSSGALVPILLAQARKLGMAPQVCQRIEDPVVWLRGNFDTYYTALSKNLRSQVNRSESRLRREGALRLEEYRGGPDLDQRLTEFFRIEASGWKGEQRTAIASDPRAVAFYTDLASAMAKAGALRLHFLWVKDQCIAADFCLTHAKVCYMMKVGYDHAWAKMSPGNVMRKLVLQHLFADPALDIYDMMIGGGEHRAYKARWANRTREYVMLRLFNTSTWRGQIASWLDATRHWWRNRPSIAAAATTQPPIASASR